MPDRNTPLSTPLSHPPTLGSAVRQASQQIDRLDARLLVQAVIGCTHRDLIASPERPLDPVAAEQLAALVTRRAAGEPLAYLTGETGFHGLTLRVTPAVLIPRPETEELVERVLHHLTRQQAAGITQPRVLDMGTGSGAIALAIATANPAADVTALDASADALVVAKGNGERLQSRVHWLHSDWFSALPAGACFDLIVSNPPYIAAGDPHLALNGLPFEPQSALTDGADGLDCLRAIIAGAGSHLAPGGWLYFEHGYDQAAAVRNLLQAAGFQDVESWCDLAGTDRMTAGCLR
jgi:release factor glutamine methyltransferase